MWHLQQTSCSRYDRLIYLSTRPRPDGPYTDEELLYWLQDEQVRQEITAQHVLIRPARGELRLFVPRWLATQSHVPANGHA